MMGAGRALPRLARRLHRGPSRAAGARTGEPRRAATSLEEDCTMRKATGSPGPSILTTAHPLATTAEHPLATAASAADNDKAWSLMYKAIIDGIGADPNNFQLVYPFTTWDWPIVPVGYTSAAQWDYTSAVPQWSATGRYDSSGTAFNDAYNQMLNVIQAATSDPKLEVDIASARNQLALATNNYDTIYRQAQSAYQIETGGTNTPPFTEWLGSYGGKTWAARLDSAWKEVESAQRVLDSLIAQTTTPGLTDAKARYDNKDYYTKYQDPALTGFPAVPGYSISMDATTWLTKVKAGTGGSSGTISFSNSQSQYDYRNTWAKGSASVGNFFWSVNVGGSWQRIDEFASDASLEATVSFKAWDQISIGAGRWYNGAFVSSMQNGPFVRGYSAYGDGGTKAVWGEAGIMSVQKVGMMVCYKPSFEIKVSSSSFKSFYESWKVSAGIRIGPFQFSGGGGSTSSGWTASSSSNTFSGTSTAETALIMGVNVKLINPK
jgi:hypothetical protein